MIRAPQFSPRQNGLADRPTRPLEIAAEHIIASARVTCPIREIWAHAVIAKNHVPHAVTGAPPALDMTGRCDISPWYSHAEFTHNPEQSDSILRANNEISDILYERNEIIESYANNAIKTMLALKSPGV